MKSKLLLKMFLKTMPYKIGFFFYVFLFFFVITFLGCKSYSIYLENEEIKQDAKAILETPKLIE